MTFEFSKKVIFFLCILFIFVSSIKVYASWTDSTRTLVWNASNEPWTVTFTTMINGTLLDGSECKENQECLIPPNSFKLIIYQTHSRIYGLRGTVILADSKGHRTAFNIDQDNAAAYPNLPWLTPVDNTCPKSISINVTYGMDGRTSAGYRNAGGGIKILKDSCP